MLHCGMHWSADGRTVCGEGTNAPPRYVPAMLSNGSLCMTVDFSGGVSAPKKERRRGMSNGIFILGKRMGGPKYALYGHGWCRPTLKVDGTFLDVPGRWSQSLDPTVAKTTVVSKFGDIVQMLQKSTRIHSEKLQILLLDEFKKLHIDNLLRYLIQFFHLGNRSFNGRTQAKIL
ncbi:MAG: hypothetical protein J6Z49_08890 [Kiritimatiellae bacterium]|nr:hypothetical protein [Kiritimatiellia bacterium]